MWLMTFIFVMDIINLFRTIAIENATKTNFSSVSNWHKNLCPFCEIETLH